MALLNTRCPLSLIQVGNGGQCAAQRALLADGRYDGRCKQQSPSSWVIRLAVLLCRKEVIKSLQ